MSDWFCPLSVDWGNVSDWIQALAAVGGVVAILRVWVGQANLTRQMEERQANLTREMQTEQARLTRQVSAEQAALTRETQKQSYRPNLEISAQIILNMDKSGFVISVRNSGLGPAIVKALRVRFQGTPVEKKEGTLVDELVDRLISALGVKGLHILSDAPTVDRWIAPGGPIPILDASTDRKEDLEKLRDKRAKSIRGMLREIELEIEYASVFGDAYLATYPRPKASSSNESSPTVA